MDDYSVFDAGSKVKEFGQAIIKAVIKTHTIAKKCQALTKEIDVIKTCGDKDSMVCTLQKYIQKYKNVLENRKMIHMYRISKQEYDSTDIRFWIEQLDILKSFIYTCEAQKSSAKETIRECLKKMLVASGKFTKNEIDILLQ